jgi:AraC-like DNA-binding protein
MYASLRKSRLPTEALDNPGLYISSLSFWNFSHSMARQEGIEDFGFLVGQYSGADSLHSTFRQLLLELPTLYKALLLTRKTLDAEASHSHITISRPDADTFRLGHHTSFGPEHPGHYQMEWYALSILVDIIRIFAGPDWNPVEIGLASHQPPSQAIGSCFPHTRFLNGLPGSYVSIESSLLSAPPFGHFADIAKSPDPVYFSRPASDLVGSLKQLVATYLPGGVPRIQLISEVTGTSVRTLQRRLEKAGLNYRELLKLTMYDQAHHLLAYTDEPIGVISHKLGYSESTHFARAFRSIAGVSPLEFRSLRSTATAHTNT